MAVSNSTSTSTSSQKASLPSLISDCNTKEVYRVGERLGSGGFAKVFHVTEVVSGNTYADKVIDKAVFKEKKNAKDKVERELAIHSKLNHEHVVKFIGHFEDASFVHLLLELCPQKTLLHVSKNRKCLAEFEVRYYIRQILLGLDYIHNERILHRDLKPGNMFLSSDMTVKIGDFGLACTFEANGSSVCGTPNYIAPEVLNKQGHSIASEVWSLGCLVYALLCGVPPFETKTVKSTYALIKTATYSFPSEGSLSRKAIAFVQSMLDLDPQERGTIQALEKHSFMLSPTPSFLPTSAFNIVPSFHECVAAESPSEFLHRAILELENCLKAPKKEDINTTVISARPTYVIKWVDYTNRFGFGYMLSDGTVGVLFNDGTKLSMAVVDKSTVQYIDKQGAIHTLQINDDSVSQITGDVRYKMQLLKYFSRYMDEILAGPSTLTTNPKSQLQLMVWNRTMSCLSLQLSMETIQVNFLEDHTKNIVWRLHGSLVLTIVSSSSVETFSIASNLPCQHNIRIRQVYHQLKALKFSV